MKFEYLIFNILIFIGPLLSSFDNKIRFYRLWPITFMAILIVSPAYILWDILVSEKHWWFNTQFTLEFRLLDLPIGEWLFFITVPFACIFFWEVITLYFGRTKIYLSAIIKAVFLSICVFAVIYALFTGKTYTLLAFIAFALFLILDKQIKTNLLTFKQTYLYGAGIIIFILIFNGYLTARPVVLYNPEVQIDLRIITIPLEDFIYGLSHILLTTMVYEKLKERKNG